MIDFSTKDYIKSLTQQAGGKISERLITSHEPGAIPGHCIQNIMNNLDKTIEKYLHEMATVCHKRDGFGIVIKVYSGEHNPPHAHCEDLSGKLLGKFEITQAPPIAIGHIVHLTPQKSGYIPPDALHKIVKWSRGRSKQGTNNWIRLIEIWDSLNEDYSIEIEGKTWI